MYKPQSLHPLSYLTGLITTIKQNIVVIIIFFININSFNFSDVKSYLWPAFLFAIFLISFIYNALEVYSTRYWIEGHHFVVTKGVFNKKRKELDIQRIQAFDSSQDIVNRIFGGVIMEIKTPSDGIELQIVSKHQFNLIEQAVRAEQTSKDFEDELVNETEQVEQQTSDTSNVSKPTQIFKLSLKELVFMALSSGSIGIALVTLGPLLGTFQEIIPWDQLFHQFDWIAQAAYVFVAGLIIVALFLAYIIGVIIEFVRYYGYTLSEKDEQLHIRYGLLNVKTINVATRRIQAVVEKQSFIRRFMGYTSIYFIITSDAKQTEGSTTASGDIMILPFVKRQKAYQMIEQLVPSIEFETVKTGLPLGGIRRHAQMGIGMLLIAGLISSYFWSWWYLALALAACLVVLINSIITVHYSGYKTDQTTLTVKKSQLMRTRYYYAKKDKLLGFEKSQNWLMRRVGLADFNFSAAKGQSHVNIGLRFIEDEAAQQLKQWYVKGDGDE
ncbi:PH domain-containing protein [Staphylococcus simulans]